MNTVGNLIWLLFGGLYSALFYFIGGLALCFTIIGIPFGLQCFKLGVFVLWPFGRKAISTGSADGYLSLVLNIIWILFGGLWPGNRAHCIWHCAIHYNHWNSFCPPAF
jgi:uncharacterized membrane protein YccF (DUF307 family)